MTSSSGFSRVQDQISAAVVHDEDLDRIGRTLGGITVVAHPASAHVAQLAAAVTNGRAFGAIRLRSSSFAGMAACSTRVREHLSILLSAAVSCRPGSDLSPAPPASLAESAVRYGTMGSSPRTLGLAPAEARGSADAKNRWCGISGGEC